ncbi:LysR family transcriptional regulator [Massilia endophytica]|uniref:LysR family transcriptional regulator n=1 Tax=Massilia endophytica TaxID=2899220 RepID=UPI001E47D25A|nr:LysR family transcriptional regulator [Massilia endophytica]UGQ45738.1 LysR family transcriptional regulator [Massilia endophytica]
MEAPSLNLVRAFVAVAERQSFVRAAEELGMTASSVSRLVKTLERHLGVVLIARTTRAMSLTEAGQRYFAECSAALEQLRGAWERIRDEQELPRGILKLSAPLVFGRQHVVPHLSAFMQTYPDVQLDLIMTDRYVDIVGEGLTLAIRIGQMDDSNLLARKLLRNRRILVASPQYLAQHGTPPTVDELKEHRCLVSTASHDGENWRLVGAGGERTIRPRSRLRADNGDAVHRFCLDGHGIAFHSAVTMSASILQGELVQVLPEWTGRETGVYCVRPSQPPGPAARAFLDFLTARWRTAPELSPYLP